MFIINSSHLMTLANNSGQAALEQLDTGLLLGSLDWLPVQSYHGDLKGVGHNAGISQSPSADPMLPLSLRSSHALLMVANKDLAQRAFSVVAPFIGNFLPNEVQLCHIIPAFK